MRILHLSNTPLSRAPFNIALCQEWSGHRAQVLLYRKETPNGLVMGGGDLWTSMTRKELVELFESADVIHLHNFAWDQMIFQVHPHLTDIVLKKKFLIQYHSDRRAKESFESTIRDPLFDGRKAVLAQYHAGQYPEAEHLVGNPLPLFREPFTLLPNRPRAPLISFAPSNTHIMKGFDYKGADKVIPVLKTVRRTAHCEYDLITGVDFNQCLLRKSYATIGIEELISGSYHLSFLEYMALGCATVANLSDNVLKTIERYAGAMAVTELQNAYTQSSTTTLEKNLMLLLSEPSHTKEMQERARNWIFKHWSVEYHVRAFDRVYSCL